MRAIFADGGGRMPKTFILGVGAQRCGTTWLHRHLQGHPRVDLGFRKEYHVFDALHLDDEGIRRAFLQGRIKAVVGKPAREVTKADLALLRFLGDTELYFDYFAELLAARPHLLATGDITPSYAALPPAVLSTIRAGVVKRGLVLRAVFLMRDPVERCMSAVRLGFRRSGAAWTVEDERRALRATCDAPFQRLRGRYDLTIAHLEAAFAGEEIALFFYEELFTPAAMERLHRHLSLDPVPAAFDQAANASGTRHAIEDGLRQEVFLAYADVYRFVAARFGEARVAALWDSFRRFGHLLA
jgi:hypothetical protein